MDYFLKFDDEAEAQSLLYTDEQPNYPNIDTLGTIYKPSGEVDADGNPVLASLPGWHVNVRCAPEAALERYAISVARPVRVWA